jgi:hypothetical protein
MSGIVDSLLVSRQNGLTEQFQPLTTESAVVTEGDEMERVRIEIRNHSFSEPLCFSAVKKWCGTVATAAACAAVHGLSTCVVATPGSRGGRAA